MNVLSKDSMKLVLLEKVEIKPMGPYNEKYKLHLECG